MGCTMSWISFFLELQTTIEQVNILIYIINLLYSLQKFHGLNRVVLGPKMTIAQVNLLIRDINAH